MPRRIPVRKLWPSLAVLLAVAAFGVARFNDLPAEMATHWNLRGEADGWSGRTLAVVGLPLLAILTAGLLSIVPRIDPKRANFAEHANAFWLLVNAVILFLALLHLTMIGTNLGWAVPINRVVGIGLGALLMVLGNYLTRIRQNWFLGIRTPWTLSSEKSWRETHRLGGRLFVAGGLLLMVTTLVTGTLQPWVLVAGVAVPAVALVIYSYVIWSRDPSTKAGA
jgi:uncharacterized membrane protein